MHNGGTWRLGRRPALDGLRGVAILLVLVSHAFPDTVGEGAGHVGVTLFFALSGFLITSLLLEERQRAGRVSFRGFYARRARRLLPALFVYLTFWLAMSRVVFGMTWGDWLGAVFYVTNWRIVFGGASYPTAITWSLSVEEQFYLLWPLAFLLVRRSPRALWIAASTGLAVAALFRVMFWGGPALSRALYFTTLAHVDSLMVGCLLALAVHRWGVPDWCRRMTMPAGLLVLALAVVSTAWVQFVAVPLLAGLAMAALIAASLAGGGRAFELAALRWVGRRSYALYLWHYPLLVLSWRGVHDHYWSVWLALPLAFVAAELSWWLVERPFQRLRSVRAGQPALLPRGAVGVEAG